MLVRAGSPDYEYDKRTPVYVRTVLHHNVRVIVKRAVFSETSYSPIQSLYGKIYGLHYSKLRCKREIVNEKKKEEKNSLTRF